MYGTPKSSGNKLIKSERASNQPAEAPMPTIKLRSSISGAGAAINFLVFGLLLFSNVLRGFAGFLLIFSAMKFRSSSMEFPGAGSGIFGVLLLTGLTILAEPTLATTNYHSIWKRGDHTLT
jgi:hypothetical protein